MKVVKIASKEDGEAILKEYRKLKNIPKHPNVI